MTMLPAASRLFALFGPEIRRQRRPLLVFLALVLPAALLSASIPHVLSVFVDDIIPQKSIPLLLRHTGLILALLVTAYVGIVSAMRVFIRASESVFADYKTRLVDDILSRKQAHIFATFDASDLITRISHDVDLMSTFFHKHFFKCIMSAVLAVTIVTYMLIWNWMLGLLALAGIPILVAILAAMEPLVLRRGDRVKESLTRQNSLLLDVFQGYNDIRFYQQHRKVTGHFSERAEDYRRDNTRFLNTFYFSEYLSENLGSLILFLPFIIGGFLYAAGVGGITIGLIVAYNIYLTLFAEMLQDISVAYNEFLRIRPSLDRLAEVHAYPDEPEPLLRGVQDLPDEHCIEFRDVAFEYRPGRPILDGVSFRVASGEKVAVMGASGSGKSTLVNLLLRYIPPTRGAILMGGRDVAAIPLPLYLYCISYVRQHSYLFRASILDNVAFGWGDAPRDKVMDALRLVRLDTVVKDLPQGLDTVIGEGGFTLSGGQSQRLALARALVREPQVLVLDEFTSALDAETERRIVDDVLGLFPEATMLCITHSPSVAGRFDRIVELRQAPGTTGR